MRRRLLIYILLVAQILLVNLGDALHRLPVLRIHSGENCCACHCSTQSPSDDDEHVFKAAGERRSGFCPFCEQLERYIANVEIDDDTSVPAIPCERYLNPENAFEMHFEIFSCSRGPPC